MNPLEFKKDNDASKITAMRLNSGDEDAALPSIDLPIIDKNLIQYLKIDEDDEDIEKMMGTEEDMKIFVKSFTEEIDRIEAFFIKRYEEYR